MALGFLINLFLAVAGVAFPLLLQAWLEGTPRISYSILQAPNWIWTLEEAADGGVLSFSSVPFIIYGSAAVVFLLNLLFAIYEVEQVRLATPERVLQDELELHPQPAEQHVRTSPWEEPMAT